MPIDQLGLTDTALYTLRGDVYKAMLLPQTRAASEQAIAADTALINKQMDLFRATDLTPAEQDGLAQFDTAWAAYQTAVADIMTRVDAGEQAAALQRLRLQAETGDNRLA